jgi:hypothetical protein
MWGSWSVWPAFLWGADWGSGCFEVETRVFLELIYSEAAKFSEPQLQPTFVLPQTCLIGLVQKVVGVKFLYFPIRWICCTTLAPKTQTALDSSLMYNKFSVGIAPTHLWFIACLRCQISRYQASAVVSEQLKFLGKVTSCSYSKNESMSHSEYTNMTVINPYLWHINEKLLVLIKNSL